MKKSFVLNSRMLLAGILFFLNNVYSKAIDISQEKIIVDKDPLSVEQMNNFQFNNYAKYNPNKKGQYTRNKKINFGELECKYDENTGITCNDYAALFFTGIILIAIFSIMVFFTIQKCNQYLSYNNENYNIINNTGDRNENTIIEIENNEQSTTAISKIPNK
jgi:hypothetical protein